MHEDISIEGFCQNVLVKTSVRKTLPGTVTKVKTTSPSVKNHEKEKSTNYLNGKVTQRLLLSTLWKPYFLSRSSILHANPIQISTSSSSRSTPQSSEFTTKNP